MEIKMFVNLLLPMERCRQLHAGGEVVREAEHAFALLEVLNPSTLYIHGMPAYLTHLIVGMAVESGDDAAHAETDSPAT
jgi:hypothetical protein